MATTSRDVLLKELDEYSASARVYETIIYKLGSAIEDDESKPEISPPKSSVQAIVDIARLSKAHTTKIGIAFKPPISVAAASKTLTESAALVPALVGSFVAVYNDKEKASKVGSLILGEVRDFVLDYLSAHKGLYKELKSLAASPESKDSDKKEEESGARLISIGKVWEACDALTDIAKLRSAKILAVKVEQFAEMVQDALDDLSEFIENGNEGNGDEFTLDFGSDVEDDDVVEKLNASGSSKKSEDSEDDDEDDKDYDHDENTEPSELQLLATDLMPCLSGLPDFYRSAIISRVNSNAQDVALHQNLYEALSDLSAEIDDLVGEFINEEGEEGDIRTSYDSIENNVKSLTELILKTSATDSNLESLVNDLIENLTL